MRIRATGCRRLAETVARYRDQDLYIAGAALDAVLKKMRGPDARIWDMVRDEVYAPPYQPIWKGQNKLPTYRVGLPGVGWEPMTGDDTLQVA